MEVLWFDGVLKMRLDSINCVNVELICGLIQYNFKNLILTHYG